MENSSSACNYSQVVHQQLAQVSRVLFDRWIAYASDDGRTDETLRAKRLTDYKITE